MSKPTFTEMYDVLSSVLDDLDSWASSGPEGYSEDDLERREHYDEFLNRLAVVLQDEKQDKVARFLAL